MSGLADMHLVVVSHKLCWREPGAPTGHATDGGFPMQMHALSELFRRTTLLLPCRAGAAPAGLRPLTGRNVRVVPLPEPRGRGLGRKLRLFMWTRRARSSLDAALRDADAVHSPIPGDIGTVGMLMTRRLGKPLFVRHCGNWENRRTLAERFWRWYLEKYAGGRTVVLATGAGDAPPSNTNPHIHWIFATSLTASQLERAASCRSPDAGGPRVAAVGRLEPGKGMLSLVRALPRLRAARPATSLHIVGSGSRRGALEREVAAHGLGDCVRLHGALPHEGVLAQLRRAHVFCTPTRSEGFPKAVLEAMAFGLPVVGTDLPVLRHLVADRAGVLLPDPDPDAIARALAAATEPTAHERLSRAALETARAYSLERWRDEIGERLRRAWT